MLHRKLHHSIYDPPVWPRGREEGGMHKFREPKAFISISNRIKSDFNEPRFPTPNPSSPRGAVGCGSREGEKC